MASIIHSSQVTLCTHPVAQHHLSILRDQTTSSELFRQSAHRVGRLIFQTATQHLPLTTTQIQTPLTLTEAPILDPSIPLLICPILRAGLILADVALDLLPSARVYHIGLYRDEVSFEPVTYYNKLPSHIDYQNAHLFLLDPMLATGGSAIAAVDMVKRLGVLPGNIHFVSLLSAPDGIQNLLQHHPEIHIFTGAIDQHLNEKAYIVPGLGDAGDRMFGTI